MTTNFTLFLIFFSASNVLSASGKISCRDEKGQATNWFAAYKFPKLEKEPAQSLLAQGEGYAYLSVGQRKASWMLSENAVSSSDSILGKTLKDFYDNKQGYTFLLYNDDPDVENVGTTIGHTKGVVVLDKDSGFWLVHSIPRFPPEDSYKYPDSGRENGQSILCITFKTEEFNQIGKQLLFNHPNFYAKGFQDDVIGSMDDDVKSLFAQKPKFIKKPPFTRIASINSGGKILFTSFAKDNQFNEDLYDSLVAPKLRTSLLVETWRRGSGTPLDPSCRRQYTVEDVKSINITVYQKSKARNIHFKSMEDHSKWAVSSNSAAKWVCIGDINRMQSQYKRGGGTVCLTSSPVWKAYRSIVDNSDHC